MVEEKDPELTSSHVHTRAATKYRAALWKTWRKAGQLFHSWGYFLKIYIEEGKGQRHGCCNTSGRDTGGRENLPEEWWAPAPRQRAPPWGSCMGRWTPITSVFESQWNIFIGYPQGFKKLRLHSSKACPQSNLLLNPAQRQEFEKHWITYEAFGLILGHVV